ncbi:uncharacterized protein LOC119080875 [Bradysia coprophila]|uniref:uncharacterized protein LOC119080875 n=1 Tax=Bradysia coprophila TaxID=38358 RepID=UPI00187DD620|nr:uncharacterized protein LOC119080875 [Bradysia coprophila]
MSCSVFKEFPESNDSHLVVVINKNGNVSVDQSELHDFLVNNDSNKSNTTVSVVRLASPTPSIEEELNEQEELEKEMAKALYATDDESADNGEKEEVIKIPNLSVVVEKYYNADEAKQFASEILSAAGITDPKQVVKDLAHQRRAVVNDHCYTPLTSPSQRKSESRRNTPVQVTKKPDVKAKPIPSTVQPKKAEASEEEEEVSDEEGDESDSENTYYSPSESDRDSDLDFNVSGRPTRVRKIKPTKVSRIKRLKGTGKVTKKRASVGDDDKSDEATTSSGKKKPVKRRSLSTNKTTTTPSTSSAKPAASISKGTPVVSARSDVDVDLKKDSSIPSSPSSTVVTPGPPVPALTPITNPKALPQKKDKKQPAHVDAYLNNMSSLFSTPDIIKKVENEIRASPTTSMPTTPSTPTNKTYFMPLNPSSIKNPQQLPAQISVQTHTATPDLEFEQDKQLDLIDLFVRDIVQEELKQTTTPHIPNIVKMLENSDGVKMVDAINPTQSTSNTSTIVNASTIRGTLLDTPDILGIGNVDDFLPDDVLQDVAKLVEDKKIQEVIDKQVLEVKATTSTIPSAVLPPLSTNITKPDSTLKAPTRSEIPKSDKKTDSLKSNLSQSATTTPVQAKEPIKIVRSDGRVILLPPLEAPTTRAKRRALTQSFDAVAKEESATSTPKSKPTPKVVEEVKEKEKTRRSSTTKKVAEPPKPKTIVPESTTVEQPDDDDYDDEDSDGSHNAEDDPYRLWCICRQPHNNRFMICCDKCEDWFHGKCVNVTKAMGTEMEEQGKEWVCPNCIKKHPGKKPPERKSSTSKNSSLNSSLLSCIVCKSQARPNSIYCSDDCIRKHAQTTATNVTSSSQSDLSSTSDRSKKSTPAKFNAKAEYTITKNNRVIVFEKKSGRVLTGNTAPTPDTLKQWLLDNPTFELVKPGSKQAQFIRVKQEQINRERQEQNSLLVQGDKQKKGSQQQQQPQKIQTTLKIGPAKNVMIVNPNQKSNATTTTPTSLPAKVVTKAQKLGQQASPKPNSPVKQSPVQSKVASKPTTPKTPAPRANQNKRKSDPKSDSKPTDNKSETSSETIRVTVHRLLNEAISQRMSEITDSKHPKLTAEEIDSFAADTEREIYNLFSKDIGAKYRAKYRSLVFNIKDRKNDSLFLKICEKTIKPNQFVRMSAEELASQQLAQWRENENKHQLEMIKKSELDLLAASKSYVLKTHKGEEVIESKVTDRLTLDPSISVEDVVSVLNNSTVSSTSETVGQITPTKDQRIDTRFDKYLSVDSSISGSSKLGSSSSKKKDGHRSRSRSRDRIQDKHDRKSSSNKHKRKRSRDRRSGEKDDKSRDRDRERDSKKKDDKDRRDREKPKTTDSKTEHKKSSVKVKEPPKPVKKEDNFNLIDKILEAQSTIDRVLRAEDTKKTEIKSASKGVQPQGDQLLEQKPKLPPSSECDQEPTSTVTIPTPPEYLFDKQLTDVESALWSGMITMVDIATFQISVHGVSGNCESVRHELPTELDIVGRIIPDTVWEYIDKIKKNKEILIVRLSAATEEDNDAYCELYKYLYTKKRLGVIKTTSRVLKDFYIFPLAAHKSIPSVLQPIDGPEFESGRPDLLLGIIVKTTLAVTTKRTIPTPNAPIATKVPRLSESLIVKSKTVDERFTPPCSPKTQPKSQLEIPIAMEDGDEPYSPGGSDDEIPFQNAKAIPATAQTSSLYAQLEQEEIERKMDELNRQIEAQKMEIAMLDSEVVSVDEPYSPSSSLSTSAAPSKIPTLANISIPSNLQEILNSIKHVSTLPSTDQSIVPKSGASTTSIPVADDDEYTPIPSDAEYNTADYVPMKTLHTKHFQPTSMDIMQSTSKEPSKLAQLTDEELLSMVPDDIDLPPVSSLKKPSNESVTRMSNYAMFEPPPPGEEEYVPMG